MDSEKVDNTEVRRGANKPISRDIIEADVYSKRLDLRYNPEKIEPVDIQIVLAQLRNRLLSLSTEVFTYNDFIKEIAVSINIFEDSRIHLKGLRCKKAFETSSDLESVKSKLKSDLNEIDAIFKKEYDDAINNAKFP
jgi:hypothetical protein